MSKEFFVGFGVGTTRMKAVALDLSLTLCGEFSSSWGCSRPLVVWRPELAWNESKRWWVRSRVTADYHGVTLRDLGDENTPEVLWRVIVEELISFGREMLATIEAEVGPQNEVFIGGGWIPSLDS